MSKKKSKSKKKVEANKKLIAVVATVAIVTVGLVGGIWYFNQFRSAERNIKAGDAMLAEGSFKLARKQYGRAVHKEPARSEYVAKLQEAITSIVPVTPDEARALYSDYLGTLVHNARYNPTDADIQYKLVYELHDAAILTGNISYWEQMQSAANAVLDRLALDDPRRYEAKIYRGLSYLMLEDNSMTDTFDKGNIRFPGELDLLDALEHDPGNSLAWGALAHGRMAIYYRLVKDGRIAQAERNRGSAEETMRDAIEAAGNTLEVSLASAKEIMLQRDRKIREIIGKQGSISDESIVELSNKVDEAIDKVLATFDPTSHFVRTREVVSLLLNSGSKGKDLAVGMLRQHLEMHDNDHGRRFALARLLHQLGRYDEAEEEASLVLNAKQRTVSLAAIDQFDLRPNAASVLFQVARDRYLEDDNEDKTQFLTEAKEHRETISDFVSGDLTNPLLLEADGDLAMLQKEYQTAAGKFEEQISRYPHPISSGNVYFKSAACLEESGSLGLARDRLTELFLIEPNNLRSYILKAQIELKLSEYDAAEATLSKLTDDTLQKYPEISILKDQIALAKSDGVTSISDPFLALIASVNHSLSLGNTNDAIDQLRNAVDSSEQPDWRLFHKLATVYYGNQDAETAILWLDKAIELNPESEQLKSSKIVMESEDRISALIAIGEARDLPKVERDAMLAVELFTFGTNQNEESHRLRGIGSDELAQKAQELSDRAHEESLKYQTLAGEAGGDMTSILFVRFERALQQNEFDSAQELLDQAKKKDADSMLLKSSEVRLLLSTASESKSSENEAEARYKAELALNLAHSMTEEVPFSALSWRTLGLVHNFNQNYKDALNSFNEAYRLSPDDVENIRRYIGAMLQTDADPQRIMSVIHLALETFPRNTNLLDMWLGLEMRFGDLGKVLKFRLDRYNREPEDRLNALQLALLLVNTQPAMVYIYNPDGSKAYSKNEWLLLTKMQQRELLSALQTDWEDKVETILDSASNESDPDIQTAIIHASIERDRGRMNAASLILDKFIDERIGSESYTKSVIAVANFLQTAQRYVQARTILEAAIDFQGEDMEISAALGSLLLNSTLSADQVRAAEVLSDAAKASGNPIIYSRWINSLIVIGKYDEAEAALEGFKGTNDEYTKAMLQSLVHRRKSEIQLAQGKTQLARGELEKYRSALSRAITADEENPIPYIQLCRSLINEYSLTQNASLLEEALEYSDQGSSFNETNEEFAIVRTDVLQADGQLRRAIESLDSFLTKVPSANLVRQKLIEAHLDADDLEKAITVTTAGVAVDPSSATWHRRLGDLLVRASDDREEAILSYLRALELEPSTQLLFLINNISRTDQPLPYQQLLQMARGEVSMQHPVAKTIEAKALLGLGQKRDAERTMALAWASFENAIASGWITPSSLSIWFADLTVIFADDPSAGEQFALQLIGSANSPEATIGLAGYWWELDRKHIERSLVLLDEVIDDPNVVGDSRIGALMRKGAFLVEVERYEEGVRMFEQLNEENPNNPLILNNLSYVVGVYLNKPSEGLELAMEAVEISPNHPSIIDTVSKLYELMGENQKAAETLDFLLQIDPVNAKAMARLALLFAGPLNKPERAVTIANRARSQQPRSPEALDALGWSYIQSGQLAKGERFLKRSLANGETPMAYIHMAQLVMKESKFDEAIGHLRIAEELSKDQHTLGRINGLRDDIRKTQTAVN